MRCICIQPVRKKLTTGTYPTKGRGSHSTYAKTFPAKNAASRFTHGNLDGSHIYSFCYIRRVLLGRTCIQCGNKYWFLAYKK